MKTKTIPLDDLRALRDLSKCTAELERLYPKLKRIALQGRECPGHGAICREFAALAELQNKILRDLAGEGQCRVFI